MLYQKRSYIWEKKESPTQTYVCFVRKLPEKVVEKGRTNNNYSSLIFINFVFALSHRSSLFVQCIFICVTTSFD